MSPNCSRTAAHGVDVPAGLDLELDPDVALVEVAADVVDQLRGCCPRSPPRPPTGTRSTTAPSRSPKRHLSRPQLGVEYCHLERCLRHPVALDRGQDAGDVVGAQVVGGKQRGSEEPPDHVDRRGVVLRGVQRLRTRDALAPAFAGVGEGVYQQGFLGVLGSERRTERMLQRQLDGAAVRAVPASRGGTPLDEIPGLGIETGDASRRSSARGRGSRGRTCRHDRARSGSVRRRPSISAGTASRTKRSSTTSAPAITGSWSAPTVRSGAPMPRGGVRGRPPQASSTTGSVSCHDASRRSLPWPALTGSGMSP